MILSDGGYIKLHRKITEWKWHDEPNTLALFIHLLLMVNFTDGEWHGIPVRAGQRITSVAKLTEVTGLTSREIRTGLTRLKSTNEITIETTNNFSLITIVNWALYQSCDVETTSNPTSNPTNERQTNDKRTTTNKNDNKEKNIVSGKKQFQIPSLAEVTEYCLERKNQVNPQKWLSYYESNGWKVGKNPMKDWQAAIRTWEHNNDQAQAKPQKTLEEMYPVQRQLPLGVNNE